MAEFLTITVHPSAQEGESLTVHDAMHQVLDIISLLDKAGEAETIGVPRVVWRLRSASTNSPFSIRAEATSSDPSVSVVMRAVHAKQVLPRSLSSLFTDQRRPEWMDSAALRTAKRIFDRTLNGIGMTEIDAEGDAERVSLVPFVAQVASRTIDMVLLEDRYSETDQTHTEYGAAEGMVLAASTYYHHPALFLKERLTGDRVTCVLTDEAAKKIGITESLNVVWEGQRVLAHGALHYGADGRIVKIDADELETIKDDFVDLNEIRAMNITGGLSPSEYLDKIREEDFGD